MIVRFFLEKFTNNFFVELVPLFSRYVWTSRRPNSLTCRLERSIKTLISISHPGCSIRLCLIPFDPSPDRFPSLHFCWRNLSFLIASSSFSPSMRSVRYHLPQAISAFEGTTSTSEMRESHLICTAIGRRKKKPSFQRSLILVNVCIYRIWKWSNYCSTSEKQYICLYLELHNFDYMHLCIH